MNVWLAIAAWFTLAGAQDAPPAPVTRNLGAPPVAVVGFQTRPGGACTDRNAAQAGQCVDVVDFFPLDRVWAHREDGSQGPDAGQRAALRDVPRLYAHAFDDLALHWSQGDIEQTLVEAGFTGLPRVQSSWLRSSDPHATYALPTPALYLGGTQASGALFAPVRVATPADRALPAETTLLAGRFAKRLGYQGQAWDYDVMDAHPSTSGPFFEQMFPYRRSTSVEGRVDVYRALERVPLSAFRGSGPPDDEERPTSMRAAAAGGWTRAPDEASAKALAQAYFEDFHHIVFVQTAQFAMSEFTTNHMRVLSAMVAIATPPKTSAAQTGIARDLVAAARGETDHADELLQPAGEVDARRLLQDTHLRYEKLPREAVEPRVTDLVTHPPSGFWTAYNDDIRASMQGMLRHDVSPLLALDVASRRAWIKAYVLAGEEPDEVDLRLLRLALARLVTSLSPDARARIDTWLLDDQVRMAMGASFDDTRVSTPKEVVEGATKAWVSTLSQHGFAPRPLTQGLGAVDPMSICTTRDGLAALDEPSFHAITVDQIVSAKPGLSREEVLASAGDTMLWRWLDDPSHAPEVTPLLRLGDGGMLYRLRWRVWSGWHLLWQTQTRPDGEKQLILRTSAMCEDMVFAGDTLVPTLVRAGLLHANFRPTTPQTPADARAMPKVQAEPKTNDELLEQAQAAQAQAEQARKQAEAAAAIIQDPPKITELANKQSTEFGESSFEIVQEPLRPITQYVRALTQDKLMGMAPGGVLVFVFDSTQPGARETVADLVPRTPYTRMASQVRDLDVKMACADAPDRAACVRASKPREQAPYQVRTAGWMWFYGPEAERPVQLSPGYKAKDSVAAGNRPPRWTRRKNVDFGLDVGLADIPAMQVTYACGAKSGTSTSAGGPCAAASAKPGQVVGTLTSQAFSVDLQALATLWAHDQPRVGVDLGLGATLDVRPGGQQALVMPGRDGPTSTPLMYAWAVRFQAGVIAGLHFAPLPSGLSRDHAGGNVWGSTRPDGRSRIGRFEWGLRTGVLLGPDFMGASGSVLGEAWGTWSVSRRRSAQASFTPYHPTMLLGPYVRASYGFPLIKPENADLVLASDHSWTVSIGLRLQLRLGKSAKLPAAAGGAK